MKSSTTELGTVVRPAYYIVKAEGDKHEYVFRVQDAKPAYLIRSRSREDTLDTILNDMCANVFEADTYRSMIEALFGEAVWKYSKTDHGEEDDYVYDFGPKPKRVYPEPEKEKEEGTTAAPPTEEGKIAHVDDPTANFCTKHQQKKHRNGKGRGGEQVYICPQCRKENVGKPRGGTRGKILRDGRSLEPYCKTHKRQKQKAGIKGGHQRYKCPLCVAPRVGASKKGAAGVALSKAPPRSDPHGICQTCGANLPISAHRPNAAGKRIAYYKKCRSGCPTVDRRKLSAATAEADLPPLVPPPWSEESQYDPFCHAHKRLKHKDGKSKTGRTKYKCTECRRVGAPRRLTTADVPEEDLRAFVRPHVARVNGYDPQVREDIVSALITDFYALKLTREQLSDPETIRRYTKSEMRLVSDRFTTVSLSAPLGEDDGKSHETVGDQLPSYDANPQEQLEAKEAIEARLRKDDAQHPTEPEN